jgi:hypothetical protein
MAPDLNKKTLRHFYCRDSLWQSFERMSEDLDRGIDDLVNEAMRLLAREKGYLSGESEARPSSLRAEASAPRPASVRAEAPARPAAAARPAAPPTAPRRAPPPPPPRGREGSFARPTRPVSVQAEPIGTEQPAPPLYLVFQNQKYLIDKDQFIIGRGVKSSDLPIRDGNISRKHAAVVRRDGAYYIKDLGSTNGIDFNGARIENKRIDEGDVFSICEYQLKFTYR